MDFNQSGTSRFPFRTSTQELVGGFVASNASYFSAGVITEMPSGGFRYRLAAYGKVCTSDIIVKRDTEKEAGEEISVFIPLEKIKAGDTNYIPDPVDASNTNNLVDTEGQRHWEGNDGFVDTESQIWYLTSISACFNNEHPRERVYLGVEGKSVLTADMEKVHLYFARSADGSS